MTRGQLQIAPSLNRSAWSGWCWWPGRFLPSRSDVMCCCCSSRGYFSLYRFIIYSNKIAQLKQHLIILQLFLITCQHTFWSCCRQNNCITSCIYANNSSLTNYGSYSVVLRGEGWSSTFTSHGTNTALMSSNTLFCSSVQGVGDNVFAASSGPAPSVCAHGRPIPECWTGFWG